jgi:hypothetical protein
MTDQARGNQQFSSNYGTLIAGSGAVGFITRLCGSPRTTAERAMKAMIATANARMWKV